MVPYHTSYIALNIYLHNSKKQKIIKLLGVKIIIDAAILRYCQSEMMRRNSNTAVVAQNAGRCCWRRIGYSLCTHVEAAPRNFRCKTSSSASSMSCPTSSTAATSTTTSSKFDHWLDVWNEHSGAYEISKLKELVNNSSIQFDKQQRLVNDARKAVDHALTAWEQSQIKHTQLMQVRDKWTPAQALEFAKLLEKEVQVRSELEHAKKDLAEKEIQQSKLQIEYMNNLRIRYHEEQIWQDKWRILSTYGTWGLIGLNTVVFLISQCLFQLRETKRMKDFEFLLKQTLSSNTSTLIAIREHQNEVASERYESQSDVNYPQSKVGQSNEQLLNAAKEEEEKVLLNSSETAKKLHENTDQSKEEYGQVIIFSSTKDDEQKPIYSSVGRENKREPSPPQSTPALLSSIKRQLSKLGTKNEKIALAMKQSSHLFTSCWDSLQQQSAEAKVKCAAKVDLPSAALGACVTSVAWLVAMTLSKKGGQ